METSEPLEILGLLGEKPDECAMNAKTKCMQNWAKVVTFCSSYSRFLVLKPVFEHSTIYYSQEHDTLCIPKDAIAENFPDKAQ